MIDLFFKEEEEEEGGEEKKKKKKKRKQKKKKKKSEKNQLFTGVVELSEMTPPRDVHFRFRLPTHESGSKKRKQNIMRTRFEMLTTTV